MSIGKLFHIIHMTGDLPALEAWYDDVFSVRRGFLDHHYMPGEVRDASLVLIADCVIEPLAPAFRVGGWDSMPLGRFYTRFGNHWHSIACYTDDTTDIWKRCHDVGVRVYIEGGVYTETAPSPQSAIMTHPKDTLAQLEFMNPEGTVLESLDPRLQPGWDPTWWAREHPTGIEGLAYTTIVTRDLKRATQVFVDVLGAKLLHEDSSELTGTKDSYVQLGETVVQLAAPDRDGTLAAADLEANGEIHHAAAFKVVDLDRTAAYLGSKGIEVIDRDHDTLLTDPASTHGAVFRWTIREIPGAVRP